jgi:hypothetical protein
MHLYFQSVHEEHQMGLARQSSNLWKMQHTLLLRIVRWFNLHEEKAFAPLHNKVDLLEDLLGALVIPLIGNNYEGHNKPPRVREFNQHVCWWIARSSTCF